MSFSHESVLVEVIPNFLFLLFFFFDEKCEIKKIPLPALNPGPPFTEKRELG
jgi:hypothetical protein